MTTKKEIINNCKKGLITIIQDDTENYMAFSNHKDYDGNYRTSSWVETIEEAKRCIGLLPINILSDSIINTTMKGRDKEFQLLIPNKRIRFYNYKTGEVGNQPTFKASYFGVNIFKEQIILVDIKDK